MRDVNWFTSTQDVCSPACCLLALFGSGGPDRREMDLWTQYRPTEGPLKGFRLKTQYSDVWQRGGVRDIQPEFRFIVARYRAVPPAAARRADIAPDKIRSPGKARRLARACALQGKRSFNAIASSVVVRLCRRAFVSRGELVESDVPSDRRRVEICLFDPEQLPGFPLANQLWACAVRLDSKAIDLASNQFYPRGYEAGHAVGMMYKLACTVCAAHVRFATGSGHWQCRRPCPFCADFVAKVEF